MKTLFVTGGGGFIGLNFVRFWRTRHPDDFIINFDALTYAGCRDHQTDLESENNYRFIEGNILDRKLLDRIFLGQVEGAPRPDLIVHFAAETHVDRSIADPEIFVKTNVLGTQTLLDVALKHGKIRFHHVSTDEVFGSLGLKDKPWTEASPYQPHSPYSASKASSDHLVRAYGVTYDLPITISNCSNNYGPYQFPEKLIPLAINHLQQGMKVPVYGKGENIRDWLHVEDHCEALEHIIPSHAFLGETFCIGGNREISNLEMVNHILMAMNKDKSLIEFVPDRPGHDFRYAMNTSKMKRCFGWQPKTSFAEGIKKTIAWYTRH